MTSERDYYRLTADHQGVQEGALLFGPSVWSWEHHEHYLEVIEPAEGPGTITVLWNQEHLLERATGCEYVTPGTRWDPPVPCDEWAAYRSAYCRRHDPDIAQEAEFERLREEAWIKEVEQ